MLKKNRPQLDMFDHIIFEKLVPKDHLLIKIDSIIDFSFIYDLVKDQYSSIGRGSKDPVMLVKIFLLEYLYRLSDVEVVKRIQTDIVFRWFLNLGINDTVPDDTTLSFFRVQRLTEKHFEAFFTEIVKKCIEKDLIRTNRFIIDSTDVAANVNYPSIKKLARIAFNKVIQAVAEFNESLAAEIAAAIESELDLAYEKSVKVSWREHFEITQKYLDKLYIKTYDELQYNQKYLDAFGLCYDLLDQYTNNKKDKIVSIVDPDARVAHKSPGNVKKGYKDHIIIDEDSEIILASSQTPFNVGDGKKLKELLQKTETQVGLKPKELSADKVYGETENRAFLKDNTIISNIAFYEESNQENNYFKMKDFVFSDDFKTVTCPNGKITEFFKIKHEKVHNRDMKEFQFDAKDCSQCPLIEQCIYRYKNGKYRYKNKRVTVYLRHDAVLTDKSRVSTPEFTIAYNKRYKIERRFATMVRNHGLRRCRYIRLRGAKIHITMANLACNIVRMVSLLFPPTKSVKI
ncbi:IS1182 family transposase [Acetobacterium fimetarium]|uniref:IS1182 family transposase n=1 Tax=Acetobacterium fimetarium TaxID=52691 RepID=A0ABR6WRV8_9FIRM|nr:IS1182 family transposase [Acetobacterium fimetarium]MBC3803291.1 IS1182 family transposase [Acetobacterium fimetarium]